LLAESGRHVRLIAQKHWRETPSGKAGGLWLPYRIEPRDRVLRWSAQTFAVLTELARDPGNGVLLREQIELYRDNTPPERVWWLAAVPKHRRIPPAQLPVGYRDGFSALVPVMDVPLYMPRLERRFLAAGGTIDIAGRAVDSIDSLFGHARVIINCTGLGAQTLCNDAELKPIRGQLLRMTNPGIDRCTADESHPLGIAYVIARSSDVILGGTADLGSFDESVHADSRQRLLDVNLQLEPRLREAQAIEDVVCRLPSLAPPGQSSTTTATAVRVLRFRGGARWKCCNSCSNAKPPTQITTAGVVIREMSQTRR